MFEIESIVSNILQNIQSQKFYFAKNSLPIFVRPKEMVRYSPSTPRKKSFKTSDFQLEVTDDYILMKNFNYKSFRRIIKKAFENNNIVKIFEVVYDAQQLKRYEQGKIASKSQVAIECFRFKPFFAMEVVNILNILALKYHRLLYRKMARAIIDNTYIKNIGLDPYKTPINPAIKQRFSTEPLPYQQEFIELYDYLKKVLMLRGIILSFDQGLGKTLTSLFLSEHLEKEQVIIICPNTLKNVWANEIMKYMTIYHNDPTYIYVENDTTKRFSTYDPTKNKYLIVNNESIQKIFSKINMEKKTMVIVDECHNFRYLHGARITMLLNLIKLFEEHNVPIDVLPMSGTPIKAKPSELTPSLMLIDPLFDAECAEIYSKCFDIDNTLAHNVVSQRFSMVIYRKLKTQVLELPEKQEEVLYYTIPKPEKYLLSVVEADVWQAFKPYYTQFYKEVSKYTDKYEAYVRRYSRAPASLTESYLRYIKNTVIDEKNVRVHEFTLSEFKQFSIKYIKPYITNREILKDFEFCETRYIHIFGSALGHAIGDILPKRRAEMFIEIIETHKKDFIKKILDNPRKVCLFSASKPVVKQLSKVMREAHIGYVELTGDNEKERPQLIEKFKNDESIKVMVASNQVIGVGVTLVESNTMYIFGTPWRKSDFNQLSDRIHRIGQTETCYINIVGLKTEAPNLFDRMLHILNWSGKMTNTYIDNYVVEDEK